MGVLGVYLLFVGITLVLNGAARITNINPKAVAVMNAITGLVIVGGSFISFSHAAEFGNYMDVASGFLFGFTYVLIAVSSFFDLDWRAFGWYSGFVAVWSVYQIVLNWGNGAWSFVWLWFAWALLFANGFLDSVVGMRSMQRLFPYLAMFVGLTAAFIPAMMMLDGRWA